MLLSLRKNGLTSLNRVFKEGFDRVCTLKNAQGYRHLQHKEELVCVPALCHSRKKLQMRGDLVTEKPKALRKRAAPINVLQRGEEKKGII